MASRKATPAQQDHQHEGSDNNHHVRWADDETQLSDSDLDNEHEERDHVKIYVGNIPHDYTPLKIKTLFGYLIEDVSKVSITKEMRNNVERSMFAILDVERENQDDLLRFNGVNVANKQLVVEVAKRPPGAGKKRQRNEEENRNNQDGTENRECRFYLRGKCNKGKNCKFVHKPPCNFYAKGKCRFQDECKYAHIQPNNNREQDNGDLISNLIRVMAPS